MARARIPLLAKDARNGAPACLVQDDSVTSVYFRRLCKCPTDLSWWSRFQVKRAASVAAFFIGPNVGMNVGQWQRHELPEAVMARAGSAEVLRRKNAPQDDRVFSRGT